MVTDIESMREMGIFTPSDQKLYWHDRLGSLRPPFSCASRHVQPSLRVAVVGFVLIIVIFSFLAVVFLFLVLFLGGLLPKEDIGRQPIRRVGVGTL
jgi:hypothetical protein